jgi:hypothetical protein
MEGRSEPVDLSTLRPWNFITPHAQMLLALARTPGASVEQLAEVAEMSRRSAFRVLADLQRSGYITRRKNGRRNHYLIDLNLPLRDPVINGDVVADLLALLRSDAGDAGSRLADSAQ